MLRQFSLRRARFRSPRIVAYLAVVGVAIATTSLVASAAATDRSRRAQEAEDGPTWTFAPSGLDGAGFQNVIAASPFPDSDGQRPIIVGADVAGVHRSVNGGGAWMPSNRGLDDQHVATLMWSDVEPGKVYAGTDTAIYVSTDFGQSWDRRPARVNFDANGRYRLGDREHPRPTGNLLAQDNSSSRPYLWAATATQGVKRSSDDGGSWDAVGLVGEHLRSIALDPNNPDVLYAAVAHGGVFVSRNARGSMRFSRIPGSPDLPEELAFSHGTLFVAANSAGVLAYDGRWHARNDGLPRGARWESILATQDANGNSVLYAGCTDVQAGKAVMKSTDDGRSWTSISTGPDVTVSSTVYGTDITWWASGQPYLRFAGPSFVAAQMIVDPGAPDSLLVAGRGGVWRGTESDGTEGDPGVTWWPAVNGLMVTVNMSVAADPKVAGRVYIGNMDYTSFASADHAITIVRAMPPDAPSTGDVITVDPGTPDGDPSMVYLGASRRGQHTGVGGIWSNPDPVENPDGWMSERLPVRSDVTALGVGHPDSGRVILAAVTDRGFWRKSGSSWQRVTGRAPFQGASTGTIKWVPDSQIVYALDRAGLWRSTRAGASGSWMRLLPAAAQYQNLDAVTVDPNDPGRVYVSADNIGGVWRVDAATSYAPRPVLILPLLDPGPIAIDSQGGLFVHDPDHSRLLRAADPSGDDPNFVSVADDFYQDNDRRIRSLSIGPDDYIYTASNHAGVTVGVPSTAGSSESGAASPRGATGRSKPGSRGGRLPRPASVYVRPTTTGR